MCLPRIFIAVTVIGGVLCNIQLFPQTNESERYVDDSYVVTCMNEEAVNITWRGPHGHIIPDRGRIHVEESKNDSILRSQAVLVFETVQRQDKGNYTCTANVRGVLHAAHFKLIVVKPVEFVGQVPQQTLVEGTNMMLRCEVTGDPEPTIVWQVKGQPIPPGEEGVRYQVRPLGLLIINVTRDDEGIYICRAYQVTQKSSKMKTQSIYATVLQKPRWAPMSRNHEKVYGYIGGVANITCQAFGRPAPGYAWYRYNNRTLNPKFTQIIHEENKSVLQVRMIDARLVLGEYDCLADNDIGKIWRTFTLLEGVKPYPPSSVVVQSVRGRSMYFEPARGNDREDEIIGYRVQFIKTFPGIPEATPWEFADYQDVSAGSEYDPPYMIIDLTPETEYRFRVAARTVAGLSEYTPERTFITTSSAVTFSISTTMLIIAITAAYLLK